MALGKSGKPMNVFIILILTIATWIGTSCISSVSALSVVVFNTGGPEVLALCAAKRCASPRPEQEKGNSVAFVTSSKDTVQARVNRLMYGLETDLLEKTRPPLDQRVKLVSTGEEIAEVLESADAFIVAAHDAPVDAEALKSAFSFVTSLKNVVLISKQDAASGGIALFGGGKNFKKAEDDFRSLVESSGSTLAILRCGTLKGGGAGYSRLGGRAEGFEETPETGLCQIYYSGNFDLANAMTTVGHDRFTLGPSIVKGDPNKMPNAFLVAARKDATDPSPTETNVCTAAVVANSLVEMCMNDPELKDLEISLGCEKSEELPTIEDMILKVKQLI